MTFNTYLTNETRIRARSNYDSCFVDDESVVRRTPYMTIPLDYNNGGDNNGNNTSNNNTNNNSTSINTNSNESNSHHMEENSAVMNGGGCGYGEDYFYSHQYYQHQQQQQQQQQQSDDCMMDDNDSFLLYPFSSSSSSLFTYQSDDDDDDFLLSSLPPQSESKVEPSGTWGDGEMDRVLNYLERATKEDNNPLDEQQHDPQVSDDIDALLHLDLTSSSSTTSPTTNPTTATASRSTTAITIPSSPQSSCCPSSPPSVDALPRDEVGRAFQERLLHLHEQVRQVEVLMKQEEEKHRLYASEQKTIPLPSSISSSSSSSCCNSLLQEWRTPVRVVSHLHSPSPPPLPDIGIGSASSNARANAPSLITPQTIKAVASPPLSGEIGNVGVASITPTPPTPPPRISSASSLRSSAAMSSSSYSQQEETTSATRSATPSPPPPPPPIARNGNDNDELYKIPYEEKKEEGRASSSFSSSSVPQWLNRNTISTIRPPPFLKSSRTRTRNLQDSTMVDLGSPSFSAMPASRRRSSCEMLMEEEKYISAITSNCDDEKVYETYKTNQVICYRKRQILQWEERFQELLVYKKEHGHCQVPYFYPDNPHLAQWVKRQRYQYKIKHSPPSSSSSSTTTDATTSSNDTGSVDPELEVTSADSAPPARKKQKKNNDKDITVMMVSEKTAVSATTTATVGSGGAITVNSNGSALSDRREEALTKIGFVWDTQHRATWMEKFEQLKAYKAEHGHCNVPFIKEYKSPNSRQEHFEEPNSLASLAVWVKCQRQQYKFWHSDQQQAQLALSEQPTIKKRRRAKSTMTKERMDLLNSIGFHWSLRSSAKNRKAPRKKSSSTKKSSSENAK